MTSKYNVKFIKFSFLFIVNNNNIINYNINVFFSLYPKIIVFNPITQSINACLFSLSFGNMARGYMPPDA